MASQTVINHMMRRLAQAFQAYAANEGWQPEDYRVFVYFNEDWGAIHLILVAKEFPREQWQDRWLHVVEFLDKELKDDPPLRDALHLVVRTFDEVAEGGLYSIGENFQDINDFLPAPVLSSKPKKV